MEIPATDGHIHCNFTETVTFSKVLRRTWFPSPFPAHVLQ